MNGFDGCFRIQYNVDIIYSVVSRVFHLRRKLSGSFDVDCRFNERSFYAGRAGWDPWDASIQRQQYPLVYARSESRCVSHLRDHNHCPSG